MALYTVMKETRKHLQHNIEWHVDKSDYLPITIENLEYIQADGDELNHILRKITNIPMFQGRVVKWYGDHAKFIVGNLFHLMEN